MAAPNTPNREGTRPCPSCGAEVPANAPCPACLLKIPLAEDLTSWPEAAAELERQAGKMSPAKPVDAERSPVSERKPGRASLVGRQLGSYHVEALLGVGGMGEVYRAGDRRLGRTVALKALPEESSSDRERLARLEREARMLAALNHPNIATIHGLEECEGTRFLVLELVEGQTLAERLKGGALPLEETLDLCSQIAEGLEAAHEKGIVHRDLKPANIKITPEGKVKILDFGLAKVWESPRPESAGEPSLTEGLSQPGAILGTGPYMSPEQAQGKPVDKRTDIWAFGCVFYRCLTGESAFGARTMAEILAAILKSEPNWQALPAATPGKVKELLRRCLQKDPKNRLHDIADARIELQEIIAGPPDEAPRGPPRFSAGLLITAGLATLVLGLLVGVAAMKSFAPRASRRTEPAVRSFVKLEPGHWLDGWRRTAPEGFDQPTRTAMAISSDGRFVVYSAVKENPAVEEKSRLYLKSFQLLEAKPIAGTDGGSSPFLSPDDRWVGFWSDGKLMKVPVEGGVPSVLCDVPVPFGFSWGPDNQIIFVNKGGLSRVSAEGGAIETLTAPDRSKGEAAHRLPCCLPGGKAIVFTIMRYSWDPQPRVAVLDLAVRRWRVLVENGADARYTPTGHLAFLRQGTLLVIPFDPDRLEVIGQPAPMVANIAQALNTGDSRWDAAAGQFSFSSSGSLVYAPGGILPDTQNSLVWVDHQGKTEPIEVLKTSFIAPRLSPDGQRIAYGTWGMEWDVWVLDLNRGTATRLTSEGVAPSCPVWSPDGQRIVFGWSKTGAANLYLQPADGSSPMERLTPGEHSQYSQSPSSWSLAGETLAFVEAHPGTGADVLLFNLRDRRVTPYLNSRFQETHPEFSPDGHWLAYVSNESGHREVYVQSVPIGKGKWQISHEGGTEPLWAPNGRQLFYRAMRTEAENPAQVWGVDIQTGTGFSAGKPRLLFDQPGYANCTGVRCWDISADGQRFLMVKLEERKPQPLTEMVLVQNWFEELQRLAPTKR